MRLEGVRKTRAELLLDLVSLSGGLFDASRRPFWQTGLFRQKTLASLSRREAPVSPQRHVVQFCRRIPAISVEAKIFFEPRTVVAERWEQQFGAFVPATRRALPTIQETISLTEVSTRKGRLPNRTYSIAPFAYLIPAPSGRPEIAPRRSIKLDGWRETLSVNTRASSTMGSSLRVIVSTFCNVLMNV